jgi:hypothetical protein
MQAHNDLQAYFQRVIGLIALMIMNLQGMSTVNAAADSLSTNMYGRWYTFKYGEGDTTSSCTQSLQLTLTCLSSFMQN